jgi:hypothetical protein
MHTFSSVWQSAQAALFEEDQDASAGQVQDGGRRQKVVLLIDVLHEGPGRKRVARQPERPRSPALNIRLAGLPLLHTRTQRMLLSL